MALGRGSLNVVYKALGKMKYVGERMKYHLGGGKYGEMMNERSKKMHEEEMGRRARMK